MNILDKLHYYHIWTTDFYHKYPAVSLRSIDSWDGQSRNKDDKRKWQFVPLTDEEKNHVFDNIGEFDKKYGFNVQIYSLDTVRWYKDLEELQEDMFVFMLSIQGE